MIFKDYLAFNDNVSFAFKNCNFYRQIFTVYNSNSVSKINGYIGLIGQTQTNVSTITKHFSELLFFISTICDIKWQRF